jgi:hypothetical protein
MKKTDCSVLPQMAIGQSMVIAIVRAGGIAVLLSCFPASGIK